MASERRDALWEDSIRPNIVLLQNLTLPFKMSKATIHKQTPYGVFVLFNSSQNQLKKREHFRAEMPACHTLQCSHCKLSEAVDGGVKLLRGTGLIICSPVSKKSTGKIHWHYVVVLLWDLGGICTGKSSRDVPKAPFKSQLKLVFLWLYW